MIKLLDILKENKILVPRRSSEERQKNYIIVTNKKIQQYIKDGGKGDLDLSGTPITSLPSDLTVGGNFYLVDVPIKSLPSGLKVEGSLYLNNTLIESLPFDLKAKSIDLSGTPIISLPSGLKVRGNLSLSDTSIESLPFDLTVGGNFVLYNTPLSKKYTKEQIKQMVPGVKGGIYM